MAVVGGGDRVTDSLSEGQTLSVVILALRAGSLVGSECAW